MICFLISQNDQSDSNFRRTNATEAPIDHVNPRSPGVTNTKGTSPDDDIQVGFTDKTTSVAPPSIVPDCLERGPTENDSVGDRKQIDRTEHLIAQLREFEEVCRVYEDLTVSAPTALIETSEPLRAAQPELTLNNEPEKLEKYSKSRDKRTKVLIQFGSLIFSRLWIGFYTAFTIYILLMVCVCNLQTVFRH